MGSHQYRIVADQNFILATRDTGYRNVASAIAELLDNGLQAGAKSLRVFVADDGGQHPQIAVMDDGSGMSQETLRMGLQFGGTSRFDDRSGQGRFGLGLPNSSMSQARRVEIYSWQSRTPTFYTYLDIDEVVSGNLRTVPKPTIRTLPAWALPFSSGSGTLVIWRKCDRVPTMQTSRLLEHLHASLGRMYRYYLWDGLRLHINNQLLHPVDPLLCHPRAAQSGAVEFGPPLLYRVRVPRNLMKTSIIRVRFSELPVLKWYSLSAHEKRVRGISRGAGVSVVRVGREVAFGWYFIGAKRRENYDDWWRCEIAFEPELDEYFGLTNSKQQISPTLELETILSKDLEDIARVLNARVRSAFLKVRTDSPATRVASSRDRLLPPIKSLDIRKSRGTRKHRITHIGGIRYRLEEVASGDEAFYSFRLSGNELTVLLNINHPFYCQVFQNGTQKAGHDRFYWECLLFALARAEAEASDEREIECYRRKRIRWSNVLATFLGN